MQAENAGLQEDPKADKPRSKKRKKEPANNKVSSMEAIVEAQELP